MQAAVSALQTADLLNELRTNACIDLSLSKLTCHWFQKRKEQPATFENIIFVTPTVPSSEYSNLIFLLSPSAYFTTNSDSLHFHHLAPLHRILNNCRFEQCCKSTNDVPILTPHLYHSVVSVHELSVPDIFQASFA